jgi:hypothetical protein
MELSQLNYNQAAEVGHEFNLRLPTGAETDIKLTVIGDLSKPVKAYSRRKFQEYQQRQEIAKRKGKEIDLSLEEAEDTAVESASIRLVNWSGLTEGGKEVKYSKEKAGELLRDNAWIREQIMEEAADVTNFQPKA